MNSLINYMVEYGSNVPLLPSIDLLSFNKKLIKPDKSINFQLSKIFPLIIFFQIEVVLTELIVNHFFK